MRFGNCTLTAWARALALLCAVLLPAFGAGARPARADADAPSEKKVTLRLVNSPLRQAVGLLLAGTGLQYAVGPNVRDVPINLTVTQVSALSALRMLVRQAAVAVPGLALNLEGDVYVVEAAAEKPHEPAADPGAAPKVTLNLKDTPLRDALDLLFHGTRLQYSVDPNVPNPPINLTVRDQNVEAALKLILRQAATVVPGLTYSRESEVYIIKIRAVKRTSFDDPTGSNPLVVQGREGLVWEKIPLGYIHVKMLTDLFGGQLLPTEAEITPFGRARNNFGRGINRGPGGGFAGGGYAANGFNGGSYRGGGYGSPYNIPR